MPWRLAVDLVAQLADEDVDGAVAMTLPPAPELLQQLVAAHDPASLEREGVEQAELGRRQVGALTVEVGLDVERVDSELLDLDRLAALLALFASAPPRGDLDPSHELLHRERLDEVVVRADLQRVHAVVLGAASADDDDRRSEPLAPGGFDQPPTVHAREHQVDDAHIGRLETQPLQPGVAVRDDDR